MQIIEIDNLDEIEENKDISLCLGFFDAIHLGHIALINKAKELNTQVAILTFSENPINLIKNVKSPIINDLKMKEEILNSLGVDFLYILKIKKEILNLEPNEFINKVLLKIHMENVICGFDYSFGKNKEGTPFILKKYNEFNTFIIDKITNANDEKISSTLIQSLIKKGEIELANKYLSRNFKIRGVVVKGFQVGRKILFNTANIDNYENFVLPGCGVYATKIIIDGISYNSMTNIGVHPTINELTKPIIETNIFDFDKDIYNKEVILIFYKKIRDEKKFSSLKELQKTLEDNELEVKKFFNNIE